MDLRVLLIAALAVGALASIGWAAEKQSEAILDQPDLENGFADRGGSVSGYIVPLTSVPAALCITLIGAVVARVPWRARALPLVVLFTGSYIALFLVQTSLIQYVAVDLAREAVFSISPVFVNAEASPSLFVGPLALLVAAGLGIGAAVRRLSGAPVGPSSPGQAMAAFLGAVVLAAPFLVILAVGTVRVMMALDPQDPAALPYMIIMPVSALAGIALLVIGSIKAWHVGQFTRHGRFAPIAAEAWDGLRKAEIGTMAVLAVLGMMTYLFESIPLAVLEAGPVFGINVQSHSQAQVLVLVLLMPWFMLHRPTMRVFRDHSGHTESLDVAGAHPTLVAFWVALGIGFIGAAVATGLLDGALWPWLFAALPLAAVAIVALPPRIAALPTLLAAAVLWGIGNTVSGVVTLQQDTNILFDTHPGILALWRALAVSLLAVAVARTAREQIGAMRRGRAWPMTSGLGAAIAVIAFLELPLGAWIGTRNAVQYVGIGTVLSSQDLAVRIVLHGIAAAATVITALIFARLARPDWFDRSSPIPPIDAATD